MVSQRLARISLLVAVWGLGVPGAFAQFGVAGGGNFQQLTDIQTEPAATVENATGFHVGIFYDLSTGPFGLRPGVFYVDAGEFEATFEGACVVPEGCPPERFDLQFIEIPVDVRIRTVAPVVRPYLLVGPVFRFAETSNEALKASLNEFTYAANVGLGVEIGRLVGVKLHTELRYAFGVSRIFNDTEFLGATFAPDEEPQLDAWMLRLGFAF